MDDKKVKFEVHYRGIFLWNPSLEYFGGKVEIVYKDPDRLSYFEIEGICEELGIDEPSKFHYLALGGNLEQDLRLIHDNRDVVSMCKLHEGGPRDTIILYVESGHAPLAVEVLEGFVGRINGGVGQGVARGGDASVGEEKEFDWLNEGLEGEDFGDDVFGQSSPPPNDSSEPNNDSPQPTIDTPQPNTNTSQPSIVPPLNIDLDEEWTEPALEDDIASMNGSDDKQRPRNPTFNERTDMTNVQLVKGMKFPNSKVFRKALREYVIQHHIDIKWKLNEKKKMFVHCKNNCGWRCYTSMVTGECTFEIKTLNPKYTWP